MIKFINNSIIFLGKCTQNLIAAIKYICSGEMRFKHAVAQAAQISYDSLLISLSISFVAAAVITIQVSKQFLMSGADSYIGGTLAIVIIREIAPAFVALSIGARAGTAISAEISASHEDTPKIGFSSTSSSPALKKM